MARIRAHSRKRRQAEQALMTSVERELKTVRNHVVSRVAAANEMSTTFSLNRHYTAITIANRNPGAAGDFKVRVFQDEPRLMLRDIRVEAFDHELKRLTKRRDMLQRHTHEHSTEVVQEQDTTAQIVALNLKALLLDTMQMTDALSAQVNMLKAKGIKLHA